MHHACAEGRHTPTSSKPVPCGRAFFRPPRRTRGFSTQHVFERAKMPDGAVPNAAELTPTRRHIMSQDHEHPHYKDEPTGRAGRLARARREGHQGRPARQQHRANAGHESRGRDQRRARRRAENLGRHRDDPSECEDRRASSRRARKRDLRGARPGAHALGRASGVHRRSRPGRLHLRAAVCAASGDQREHRRPARMRAGAQRQRSGGGQSEHRRGGSSPKRSTGSIRFTSIRTITNSCPRDS